MILYSSRISSFTNIDLQKKRNVSFNLNNRQYNLFFFDETNNRLPLMLNPQLIVKNWFESEWDTYLNNYKKQLYSTWCIIPQKPRYICSLNSIIDIKNILLAKFFIKTNLSKFCRDKLINHFITKANIKGVQKKHCLNQKHNKTYINFAYRLSLKLIKHYFSNCISYVYNYNPNLQLNLIKPLIYKTKFFIISNDLFFLNLCKRRVQTCLSWFQKQTRILTNLNSYITHSHMNLYIQVNNLSLKSYRLTDLFGKNTDYVYKTFYFFQMIQKEFQCKYLDYLHQIVQKYRNITQMELIKKLNFLIRNKSRSNIKSINNIQDRHLDYLLHNRLYKWTIRKHPSKSIQWINSHYWRYTNLNNFI